MKLVPVVNIFSSHKISLAHSKIEFKCKPFAGKMSCISQLEVFKNCGDLAREIAGSKEKAQQTI